MITNKHTFKSDSYKCKCCGQDGRNTMTIHCPFKLIKPEILSLIVAGRLDFKNGDWTDVKTSSINTKADYIPTPGIEFISSISEFMKAMRAELSPEASDELTNEDIDLLKNINSTPLPVSCVSKLELPVDQLVSLHKLKRLGYVKCSSMYKESYSYKLTDEGVEYLDSLKPKPVTLTMPQLHALASIGDESMSLGDVSGYGIWTEVEYLKKLDMVHQKSGKAVISIKGYGHLQKLLAVPLTTA